MTTILLPLPFWTFIRKTSLVLFAGIPLAGIHPLTDDKCDGFHRSRR